MVGVLRNGATCFKSRSMVQIRNSKRQYWVDPHVVISTFTETFQTVHTYTNIPWWALIPVATFSLRTVWTMPLAVLQRKRLQKQSELRPIIGALNPVLKLNLAKKVRKAKNEAKTGHKNHSSDSYVAPDPLSTMKYEEILVLTTKEVRKRQKLLFKKNGVQIWKNFILPAFQIPLWVVMSLTMRDLSGWSSWNSLSNKPLDPSLYTEGLWWFYDLTVADNLHVLPLLIGITALCNVEWTFKSLELLRLTQRKKLRITVTDAISNISRMTVVFLMAISLHAPAALSLYWLSSQFYSLIQNIILDLTMPVTFTPNKRLNYKQLKVSNAIDIVNHHVNK